MSSHDWGILFNPCAAFLMISIVNSAHASVAILQAQQPAQVTIHNATALKVQVASAAVSPASAHLLVNLKIINTYPAPLTAVLIQLPSDSTGRRTHGRDYFGSDKPAGLQPGQEDVIPVVLPDPLSTNIEISAVLLSGGSHAGRHWAVAELLAIRQAKLDFTLKLCCPN